MRDITSTLSDAGQSANRHPITKVLVENARMDKPAYFTGDFTDSRNNKFYDFIELDNGNYFRAAIKSFPEYGLDQIKTQTITDPSDAAQWTTWTSIGVLPPLRTNIALSTSGTEVNIFYFVNDGTGGKSLKRKVSNDYGVTWGVAETWKAMGSQDTYYVTSPAVGVCFIIEDVATSFYKVTALWKSGATIIESASPYNVSWAFSASVMGFTIDSIETESGKYLVVVSTMQRESSGRVATHPQPRSFFFEKPEVWSPLRTILGADSYNVSGTDFSLGARLSSVNGRIFCYLQCSRISKVDTIIINDGQYVAQEFARWIWSNDGLYWSLDDEYTIPSTVEEGEGRKCFVDGGYFYEVGWERVWRAAATYIVGSSSQTNLTVDVPSWTISKPTSTEAGVSSVDIFNEDGKYNSHSVLDRGARVQVQGGYKTSVGDEYTNLITGWVDSLDTNTERARNQKVIRIRDGVRKLKQKASRARIYLSQSRFYNNFDNSGDDDYFLHNYSDSGVWYHNEVNSNLQATTEWTKHYALAGFYERDSYFITAKFKFGSTITDAEAGILFCVQPDDDSHTALEEYYLVGYFENEDRIQFLKASSGEDMIVKSSSLKSWNVGTYYWLGVYYLYNTFYMYSSTDGVYYTFEFKLSDPATVGATVVRLDYTIGSIGIHAYPSSGGTVDFDEFMAVSLDTDWSVEDIIEDAATRAGVDDFDFETSLHDNFSDNSLDSDKWSAEGKTGTWAESGATLNCSSSPSCIRSTYSTRNIKATWDMKLHDGQTGGVIWRSSADMSDRYEVQVVREAESDLPVVQFYKVESSVRTAIFSARFANWLQIDEDTYYTYTLSAQGRWMSVWCEGRLLASVYDDTFEDAGYFGLYGSYSVIGAVSYPMYFDNVRVGALDLVVPLWTINPGDPYENTLKSLVEVEDAHYFFDGDGTLKVRSTTPSSTSFSFEDEIHRGASSESDLGWISSARVDGENCFAIYYDLDTLDDYGSRFSQFSIRELTSGDDCYEAAQREVTKSKRGLYSRDFDAPAQVGLEVFDKVGYTNAMDGIDDEFLTKSLEFRYCKKPVAFGMSGGLEGV